MAEDSYKLLEWGLEEESCLPIKSQSLGTVVQFREKEFLVLGQKEVTRFESTLVKESYPYVLTALVPIPKYDILIGVTAVSAEFIILFMSDLKQNLMTGVKVNDRSVFNIIYSAKSNTIITSGEHLITWAFHYSPPEPSVVFTYPTIEISMKKIILSHFHSSIMNPPMFDYSHEELYINDNKGSIQSYNLNGTSNGAAIKYDSTSQAACGFYAKTQYFMTTNASQGAILWPKRTGGISKRFFIGTSASLAIQFIDDEYVAILDAKYTITIIDIKTSNFVNCYQSNFPIHRMFYFKKPYPRIVLCAGSTVVLLKVNLPWRFWNPTFGKPISITRSNKKDEAARITVVLENSHVRLISPKTSNILTAATLTSLATPITCFYDRGIIEQHNNKYAKRDQLLIPLQNGPMQIFSTGQDPCQMIGSIDIKVTTICQCNFRNEWCFCFGTSVGQLLFYSYSTMKSVGRIVCSYKHPIIGTFYDKESECLILAFNERVCLLSLKNEKEVGDYIQMKCSKVSLFFDRILIFAGEKGVIRSLYVLNQQILLHETNSMRLHEDTITGFSLGSSYFVSSSIDKTVRVWSREFNAICKLVFPLPIQQCCAMNGKRDILAATMNDIMIIKGSDVFGDFVDLEDEVYDNYDRKTDKLDNSFLMFPEEEEDKGESVFAGRKKKVEKKKGKVNARRKRIIEALKKQMLLMEQKNNQIEENLEEIETQPKNKANLPNNQNDQPIQRKEENSSQKNSKKSDDESSYEYALEEEEDRKSNSSQPVVQKAQKQNDKKDKIEKEKVKAPQIDNEKEKEKEEMEKKRKLLEKQKAEREKEEKEKEILKMYNDAKRAKEIKEPTMNSKPRPNRHRALQPKVSQSSNENEEENLNSVSDESELTKESQAENENQKENEQKEDASKSKPKLSSKKKSNKSKNGNTTVNQKDDEESNSNTKDNSKEEKTDKSKSKNKTKTQKKLKQSENENQDENDNNSQKSKNKDKKKSNNKTSNKEENNNNNKSNNTKEDKKDQSKSNSIINKINDNKKDITNKNKDNEKNLDKANKNNKNKESIINKINDKNTDNSNQTNKNKENDISSKTKSKSATTTKDKLQTINPKKGYKNASSQTVDPSSLKKVCDVPKTVPSNVAIVPQIAKARRIRRSPTPPTNRPQRERRPLFEQNAAHKRSRTPEPLRLLVDGSAPPVNLFFDINMVKKMVENGDKRYVPLLQLLERQGLKSSNFSSLPLQKSNRNLKQKNLRKGAAHFVSPPSWGVMVTLPPINVSQVKIKAQSNNILSDASNKKLLEESNNLNLNNIDGASSENKPNKDEDKFIQNNEINQDKSSSFKFTNVNDFSDRFNENEFSYDFYQNPVSLLFNNNQALSMKKMQKSSNKSRGSSVPNANKTVAEMNFYKDQLMQKIKEKRAKEANQNDSNEKETDSKSSNSSSLKSTNQENNKEAINLILNKKDNEDDNSNKSDSNLSTNQNNMKLDQNETEDATNETRLPTKPNAARFGSLNLNPRFSNQMPSNLASSREPTFVEPIMPIYLRTSKDVRYIKQDGISPFACKRYRMVVDSNGPRDAKNFPSHRTISKSVNNSKKTLIDQYIKSPRQLLKPLQMVKAQPKH